MNERPPSLLPNTADAVQANILRVPRFADADGKKKGRPRDWTLFFFFRILPEAEQRALLLLNPLVTQPFIGSARS